MARAAAVCLLLIAMAFTATLTAAAASAHAVRLSTDPAENAQLTVGPARVSATFNERLQTTFAAMTVVGPDGNLWSSGEPQVQGAIISVGVRPLGPVGRYRVNYRVTSADGHVVPGSWSFQLTAPGTGTPGPSAYPADTTTHDIPIWPFVAATVLLIAGAGLWAVRRQS
ncbi:MAG: copper resistance CopC family protein [Mycobacterium sp.]